ncbi:MAG: AAA family ATPase [Bacilli bacterium]|nr:AAA family ATPase [Bacilli bacterium]
MKFFDKTEEEKKREEEKKQLTTLEKAIIYSDILKEDAYKVLTSYIMEVKSNKRKNDFFELDFLVRVFLQLIDQEFGTEEKMQNQLDKIILIIRDLLPAGIKTSNYTFIKEMIINNFVSKDGYLAYNLFDMNFYSLFDNKTLYLNCMNIILNSKKLRNQMSLIIKYACKVSRYSITKDMFYSDMIAFLAGMEDVVNNEYVAYANACLEIAKKRVGVYAIDEKKLALCNSNVERVEGYLDQMKVYEESLENTKTSIGEMLRSEKEEIKKMRASSIQIFRKEIQKEKEELLKKLDEYLLDLEVSLKEKSDDVFKEILANYQKQIREMHTMFQGYSRATSEDLIRIQKAAEDSLQELKNYVQNDDHLKEVLTKANESNEVREKIVQLVEQEKKLVTSNESGLIPGMEKVIVPATPQVIIPQSQQSQRILSAFDEKIPFSLRLDRILALKEANEKKGKIYHEKTIQIVKCLMEGDWPYLLGPSGCGKSYLMSQVAELLGIELVKSGKITEPYTVMGYTDPQGKFRATQTYIALVYGKLLGYDEFDNGNPDTHVVINEIYSKLLDKLDDIKGKHYVTFAEDVPAEINPNFRMISAGNTTGGGENALFSSRGKLDESVQERMTPIRVGYDNRVEEQIFGQHKNWYNFFVKFREACDNYALNNNMESAQGIGTTRDAAAIVKYIKHDSKTLDELLEEKFTQTKDMDYLSSLAKFIGRSYDINVSEVKNPNTNNHTLESFSEQTIAKKFIYKCKSKKGNI